jgi:hypothetical protein
LRGEQKPPPGAGAKPGCRRRATTWQALSRVRAEDLCDALWHAHEGLIDYYFQKEKKR